MVHTFRLMQWSTPTCAAYERFREHARWLTVPRDTLFTRVKKWPVKVIKNVTSFFEKGNLRKIHKSLVFRGSYSKCQVPAETWSILAGWDQRVTILPGWTTTYETVTAHVIWNWSELPLQTFVRKTWYGRHFSSIKLKVNGHAGLLEMVKI